MAIRANHYDAAFEEHLRALRVPYVSVDETRRALLADASLKSFDFIVESPGRNLLADVKGRLWRGKGGRRWENWATEDDVASLLKWEGVFGGGFRAALVFAYHFEGEPPEECAEAFEHAGRRYFFSMAWVDEYAGFMRRRSASWETVSVPAAEFAQIRRPLAEVLGA